MKPQKARARPKPKLYLLVYIGPLGLSWTEIRVLAKPPESLYAIGRGEGQALLFKLDKFDCSTEFFEALMDGRVAEDSAKFHFKVNVENVIKASKD
jgi:hypothetical protein